MWPTGSGSILYFVWKILKCVVYKWNWIEFKQVKWFKWESKPCQDFLLWSGQKRFFWVVTPETAVTPLSDAPRRFPDAWKKDPYYEELCQAGMRDVFIWAKALVPSGGLKQHCMHLEHERGHGTMTGDLRYLVQTAPLITILSDFFAAKWVQIREETPLPTWYQVSPKLTDMLTDYHHHHHQHPLTKVILSLSSSYNPVEGQGDGVRVYHPHTPFTPPTTQETSGQAKPGILTPDVSFFMKLFFKIFKSF